MIGLGSALGFLLTRCPGEEGICLHRSSPQLVIVISAGIKFLVSGALPVMPSASRKYTV